MNLTKDYDSMDDIHLDKITKAAKNKALALVVGSRLGEENLWKALMNQILFSLGERREETKGYIQEILAQDITVEAFFRIFYQEIHEKILDFLGCFSFSQATPFHKALAKLIQAKAISALGLVSCDNRLSLALQECELVADRDFALSSPSNLPYVSWIHGEISQRSFLADAFGNPNSKWNSLSEAGTVFFKNLKKAEVILVAGLLPGDFCWRTIYGYLTEYAKKNKPIYWVTQTELIPLTHLMSLGNGALLNQPLEEILQAIYKEVQGETASEFSTPFLFPSVVPQIQTLEEKPFGKKADELFLLARLLNHGMNRPTPLKILDAILPQYLEQKAYFKLAQCHRLQGTILLEQGFLEKSIEAHGKAIEYWALAVDDENLAWEYVLCGDNYWAGSAVEKALQYYGEAHSLYRKIGDKKGIGDITGKLALICDSEEDYELAFQYYQESFQTRQQQSDFLATTITLINLGNCLIKKNDWNEAQKYLEMALQFAEQEEDMWTLCEVYQLLGLIYMNAQDFTKSRIFYEKAYTLYKNEEDYLSLTFVYCNLGHVCARLEDYESAIRYYESSLDYYEKMGDWQHLASVYTNLGLLYSNKNEHRSAEDYFSRAEEIFAATGDVVNLIKTHSNLAKIYTLQGEMENAIECYRANMEMQIQLEDKAELASTLVALSMVYLQTKQIDKTLVHLQKAIALYDVLGLHEEKKETAQILGIIQTKMMNI